MPLVTYNNWQDGLNVDTPPDNMKDSELRRCDNVIVADRGGFRRRSGCSKLNPVSYNAEAEQLIEWVLSSGNVKLVAVVGNKLCLIDEAGNKLEKLTLSRSYIGYVAFKDMLFFVDGSKYYVWGSFDYYTSDGTKNISINMIVKNHPISTGANAGIAKHYYKARSNLGSINLAVESFGDSTRWIDITDGDIPDSIIEVAADTDITNDLTPIKRCKYLAFHPSSLRIFAAGDSEDPTALYYSEINKPNFFKKVSKLYPVTSSGAITGLAVFLKSVLVAYKMSFMVWSGTDPAYDATWKQLAIPTGCVAHDTIALTPVSLTFLGMDGIYTLSGAMLNDDMVMVVDKELFTNLADNKVKSIIKEMAHKETAKAIYHNGLYYLAYGDDTNNPRNNKELVLNWSLKSFVRFTGRQINSYCPRANGDLLIASKNYILKADLGLNDIDVVTGLEKPVKLHVTTKPLSIGSTARAWIKKTMSRIFISAQQYLGEISKLRIIVKSDYVTRELQTSFNESLVYGRQYGLKYGFIDIVNQEGIINQSGLRHEISFIDETMDNELFIYGFGVEFEETNIEGSKMEGVRLTDEAY